MASPMNSFSEAIWISRSCPIWKTSMVPYDLLTIRFVRTMVFQVCYCLGVFLRSFCTVPGDVCWYSISFFLVVFSWYKLGCSFKNAGAHLCFLLFLTSSSRFLFEPLRRYFGCFLHISPRDVGHFLLVVVGGFFFLFVVGLILSRLLLLVSMEQG